MAICRVYRERSERENIQWVAVRRRENTLLMSGLSREWPDWVDLLASQTRYNRCLPESVSECTTHRNLKQMSDVNRRPHHVPLLITGNRAAVLTASSKTGQQKMGKMLSTSYLIGLDFCCDIQMTWSEFGIKNTKACFMFLLSTVQADGGVMVWGDIFLAPSGPLSANWALFKHHNWIYVESISVRIKPVLKAKPNCQAVQETCQCYHKADSEDETLK